MILEIYIPNLKNKNLQTKICFEVILLSKTDKIKLLPLNYINILKYQDLFNFRFQNFCEFNNTIQIKLYALSKYNKLLVCTQKYICLNNKFKLVNYVYDFRIKKYNFYTKFNCSSYANISTDNQSSTINIHIINSLTNYVLILKFFNNFTNTTSKYKL